MSMVIVGNRSVRIRRDDVNVIECDIFAALRAAGAHEDVPKDGEDLDLEQKKVGRQRQKRMIKFILNVALGAAGAS